MPLYLYNSNRLEILAKAFSSLVTENPLPPISPEIVVLQSGGMARWLSMQVAERSGVCANLDCPFPNQFVDRIFRKALGDDVSKTSSRETLQWQLMKLLPQLLAGPEFGPLKSYLKGASDVKLFRLAGRIADLFDQYTIFRPEMVMGWERGEGDDWQASLWRNLIERDDILGNLIHRAALREQFFQFLAGSSSRGLLEQGRFSVFGLSSIPVFHIEILTALSEFLDVHFFFMNPCREFWDDIVPGKVIDKLTADKSLEPEEYYFHEGNPLLASSGRQGKELITILHNLGEWEEYDLFAEPFGEAADASLLNVIQSDILNLRSAHCENFILSPNDNSIQLHSCHSPMRELEVLHDQLLKMFMEDPTLEPKDILVMTPDIDFYSPLIQVAFSDIGEGCSIPYSIADRKLKSEGVFIQGFLDVLDLRKTRMEISGVLDILENESVRRKFNIGAKDLERIEKWLLEVNIRWGVSAESKVEMGLPEISDNTWRQGLDRLLLGYAMAGKNSRTFGAILAADNVEGNDTEVLGRFIDFTEKLFQFSRETDERKNLVDWADYLITILNELFEPVGDQEREFSQLVEFLGGLKERQEGAGYEAVVDYEVIQSCLDKYLAQGGLSTGFMTGAVTFCELLPMRAVPFRCVCLLGMNEATFPRVSSAPSFNLIASFPKPGDRSKKTDDRYLFLETLLSARDKLYISYVGQSIIDGSALLPSLLVNELIDYLGQKLRGSVDGDKELIIRHPMHRFSNNYYSGDKQLVSFSKSNYLASQALLLNKPPVHFVKAALPELPDEYRHVELEELTSFFKNPAKYFCRKRLGIYLAGFDSGLEGNESFTVGGLERYKAGNWLLEKSLAGSPISKSSEILQHQGIMPHGNVGIVEIEQLEREVSSLANNVSSFIPHGRVRLAEGSVEEGGFTVSGSIDGCEKTKRQVIYRFSSLKTEDQVSGWIKHLFFNCVADVPDGCQTIIIGNDKSILFEAVSECRALLTELLEMYWLGMRKILPFFPRSSYSYAESLRKKNQQVALSNARSTWMGGGFSRGEGEDPYYKLCLRDTDPIDEEFINCSVVFYESLINGRGKP